MTGLWLEIAACADQVAPFVVGGVVFCLWWAKHLDRVFPEMEGWEMTREIAIELSRAEMDSVLAALEVARYGAPAEHAPNLDTFVGKARAAITEARD